MLKVLVIEDEPLAREELSRMIQHCTTPCEIVGEIDSVEEALEWFSQNPMPNLIFVDIQLSDGVSFEIFKKIEIKVPCIFTTAYQEYAIDAFKQNSIDYLLKPVHQTELDAAVEKYNKIYGTTAEPIKEDTLDKIYQVVKEASISASTYKTRFLLKRGESFYYLPSKEIAFIWAEEKLVFAKDLEGKRHVLDFTVDQLDTQLNPMKFFRINRAMIVAITAIVDIQKYFNGRLLLKLKPEFTEEVFVARQRVKDFLLWLDT
ncbi:MAG: LytR/AlgR family response regulator transcription factor [Luteibaculaceae bacterium]